MTNMSAIKLNARSLTQTFSITDIAVRISILPKS